MEPEKSAQEPTKAPVKDWSSHGQDYAAKITIRADYAEKERVLQERDDLSAKGKRQLQAFLRMERIAAEARADGQELGGIKRHIDSQGVVIFSLESGGSIRDAGREVFFSSHDPKAESAAMLYAAQKWGKRLAQEKGCITFQPDCEIERPAPELSRRRRGLSR